MPALLAPDRVALLQLHLAGASAALVLGDGAGIVGQRAADAGAADAKGGARGRRNVGFACQLDVETLRLVSVGGTVVIVKHEVVESKGRKLLFDVGGAASGP